MIARNVNDISAKWWSFLLRGIVALLLAACVFILPLPTAGALIYVFAAYFIISGIAALFVGFSFSRAGHWWILIFSGIVQILLGFVMLSQPGAGPLALAYLFAMWMIMTGVAEITAAVSLHQGTGRALWWIVLGVVTLSVGFYVIVQPALGVFALVYTVGFYAVVAGVSLIGFAFHAKSLHNVHPVAAAAT